MIKKQDWHDAINANEMKSRFLSSISHDIRTSINGIQGMLRIADTYLEDMKIMSWTWEIARFHLEQKDIEVIVAVNGQEAVDMFAKSEV